MKPHEERRMALLVNACLWAIIIGLVVVAVRAVRQDATPQREVRFAAMDTVPPPMDDSSRAKLLKHLTRRVR